MLNAVLSLHIYFSTHCLTLRSLHCWCSVYCPSRILLRNDTKPCWTLAAGIYLSACGYIPVYIMQISFVCFELVWISLLFVLIHVLKQLETVIIIFTCFLSLVCKIMCIFGPDQTMLTLYMWLYIYLKHLNLGGFVCLTDFTIIDCCDNMHNVM